MYSASVFVLILCPKSVSVYYKQIIIKVVCLNHALYMNTIKVYDISYFTQQKAHLNTIKNILKSTFILHVPNLWQNRCFLRFLV